MRDLELVVHLVGGLADEEQPAPEEDEVPAGEHVTKHAEQGLREAHHPGDREQEPEAHDERQGEPDSASGRLLLDRELAREDRDEDHVVDPEHDLHRRQREEADPGVGLGERREKSMSYLACDVIGGRRTQPRRVRYSEKATEPPLSGATTTRCTQMSPTSRAKQRFPGRTPPALHTCRPASLRSKLYWRTLPSKESMCAR